MPDKYDYINNVEDLKASAATCRLCALMLHVCNEPTGKFEIQPNYSQKSYRWSTTGQSGRRTYFYCFKEDGSFLVPKGVRDYAPKWDQAPIQTTGLRFEVAETWLRRCLNHAACRREVHSQLPTRILDIGCDTEDEKREPALILNSDKAEPYVTLSYSWGGAQPLILTLESLPSFVRGIPMSDLPLLFQETIMVLRALEIRYLWIDALCIVQPCSDGGQDWEKESTKMRSVYANSLFTISAAASYNPHDGLFGWNPERYVRVKPNSSHSEPFCIGASLHVRNSEADRAVKRRWGDHIASLPISTRAWTLQERYLPPAVLHFDQDDACWECRTGVYDGREGRRELDHVSTPDLKLIVPLDSTWRKDDVYGRWYNLVEEFQRRKITDVKDRLAAFSGFAESFSMQLKSDYWAGLWRKDMHRGLLWMRAPTPESQHIGGRVFNEKAPTWSWAHMNDAVEYHLELNPLDSKFPWTMLSPAKEHKLNILKVDIRSRQGLFGTVEEGTITAEGLLEHRVWAEDELLQGCTVPIRYNFDGDTITDNLSLLLVGAWENLQSARALFLILQRAGLARFHFRRVGVAWHDWEIERSWGVQKAAPIALRVSALLEDATRVQLTLV